MIRRSLFRLVMLCSCALLPLRGLTAQQLHINVTSGMGGFDRNYPNCGGRGLFLANASAEYGGALFGEVMVEAVGMFGAGCGYGYVDPVTHDLHDVDISDSTSRLSLGVGHILGTSHIAATLRAGAFRHTTRPFVSGNIALRVSFVRVGFELGEMRVARPVTEDPGAHRWCRFGDVFAGLRF